MYSELGFKPSAAAVAQHYGDILDGFVLDNADRAEFGNIQRGIIPLITDIIMKDKKDRIRLAEETLKFGESIFTGSRIE
jgi:LPPG:FO 2-phospho-L-lactate transferase